MSMMATPKRRKPIFLFTHPRTASNLLLQMLKMHPEIGVIDYPFIDTYYFGQESLTFRCNARMIDAKQRMQDDPTLPQTFQAAFDQMEQTMENLQAAV